MTWGYPLQGSLLPEEVAVFPNKPNPTPIVYLLQPGRFKNINIDIALCT